MKKLSQAEIHTRRIELEGCHNLRDIGGYATTDGRQTRWKTVFRADGLHRLPPFSQEKFLEFSIRTIIDLRRPSELAVSPNVFATSTTLTYLNISINPDEKLAHAVPSLVDLYKNMLDTSQPQFRVLFDTLLLPDSLPLLVHCTAGKDRTGMVIALLLALANVPAATIAADYAISTEYLRPIFGHLREQIEQASPGADMSGFDKLLVSEPEMMLETLAYLENKYGGARQYLSDLGFSEAQLDTLRDRLTEPAA